MSQIDDIRNFASRRRNLLFLMQRYLQDNGYYSTADALKTEARLPEEYELCDNIDLDAMYLEYASYYNLKFGKYPKILKKSNPTVKVELSAGAGGAKGANAKGKQKKSVSSTLTSSQHLQQSQQQTTLAIAKDSQFQQQSPIRYGAAPTEQQASKLKVTVKKLETDNNDSLSATATATAAAAAPPAFLVMASGSRLLPEVEHASSSSVSGDNLLNSVDWQNLADLVKTTILNDEPKLHWSDICGNVQAIELIKEAVLAPINYPQLFANGLKPWRSVLLHGPPGSGKTLLAKTLYAETHGKVNFFNITSSILVSKWRGESEKILRVLFHMAEKQAPSIIFLDEIEGLTSKRDRPTDHESSKRFKNELLQLLDGMEHNLSGVFVLASTNLPWDIDDAFLRRFEKKLLVQLPNAAERGKLIGQLLPSAVSLPVEKHALLVRLSDHFTGDEIRLACKEIAMQSVRRVTRGKAEVEPPIERAFQQIKPLSLKLMGKHVHWQQEHGS